MSFSLWEPDHVTYTDKYFLLNRMENESLMAAVQYIFRGK